MKHNIFLILFFFLSFCVESKEIEMDSKKCELYAFHTFKNESMTKSMHSMFTDALPSMTQACSDEIKKIKDNDFIINKTFGYKLENGMLSRYDGGRLKYTKPLDAISEIGVITRTPIHSLYTFPVSFIKNYIAKGSEDQFNAVFFTEKEAEIARESLISAYSMHIQRLVIKE